MHKSLPAPPLTQMHTQPSAGAHTHTQTQQLTVLAPLNCNTPRLLFACLGTEWCNMKHQLQIAENGSYWRGSAAIRGQSLYVHPGAASAAPLWSPEDTRKHTHTRKVKSKGTVLFVPAPQNPHNRDAHTQTTCFSSIS